MALRTPFYTTATEVKERTRIVALQSALDADVNHLIIDAEDMIDAYCGYQAHNQDEEDNLDRVFPRKWDYDDDGDWEIPYQIKSACLKIVEQLFLEGVPDSGSESVSGEKNSETIGELSYSYSKGGGGASSLSSSELSTINAGARLILTPFRCSCGALQNL